ncbi:MAG: SUMF1/EgtB/PvdO family nonheme iron enzyme [Akkermansiaceae bacterium]
MIRSEIHIPDHEVLRKIGGGAYGEVWMARGVTGALRAVKVVWREDFEDERGFEREFEGILKFEPISRDHPGFVNILHVGRSNDRENPFYYYVMELGDDVHSGRKISPVEYEARTLRSDLKASAGAPLDVGFCIDVGQRLAETLQHLHESDLAHRDVKPANVIFVEGKAKLADIGLVAARGQETFVGTEGFVPPEGPGSGQADIYSLGKVLYEMATGKDRLQFPELPDELPEGTNKKNWVALNELICNICDPKLSKRTINTAKKLAESLAKIKQGKKVRQPSKGGRVKVLLSLLMLAGLGYGIYHFKPWMAGEPLIADNKDTLPKEAPKYQYEVCSVQFISHPTHAVITGHEQGRYLETNTEFIEYAPGTVLNLVFKHDGYRPKEVKFVVPDKQFEFLQATLDTFLPPKLNERWVDSVGALYFPRVDGHESGYVRWEHFNKFLATKVKVDAYSVEKFSERGEQISIVMMTENTANKFAYWLEQEAKLQGLLEEDQWIVPNQDKSLQVGPADKLEEKVKLKQFATKCIAQEIPYATLELTSVPVGARVYIDGEWVGVTPMTRPKQRPKKMQLEFSLDGYKGIVQEINLSDNETRPIAVTLQQNNGVVFGQPWVNGLKVKMVPFDEGKLASSWEVRVKDYRQFVQATSHRGPSDPLFPQKADHPVVGVNRDDAEDFCKWLTEKERKEDRIRDYHEYRLPTDEEWSLFCGLSEERGTSPIGRYYNAQQNPDIKNMYPWGENFPPDAKVGNLADKDAAKASAISDKRTIQGYADGFTNTAPVGSFEPNALGMYDVSGNVFEWLKDPYSEGGDLGIVRGGSWATYQAKDLKSWSRFAISKDMRDNQYGFRVVLVDTTR